METRTAWCHLAAASTAIACALQAAPAWSQSETHQAIVSVEEVVVTARRREESLQDVPISVSAISGDAIREATLQSTADLQYVAPSVNFTTTGAVREIFAPSIRGQRTNDALTTTDAPVALYFGDTLITRPVGFNQAMYDVGSVQVLKGVQGTLFGRNTTGGAIILTPKAPTDRLEGDIQLTGGNFDLRQVTAALNLPLGETFAARIAGRISEHDGYGKNALTGDELDSQDLKSARVSLQWQPTDSLRSLLIYDHYEHDQAGTASSLVAINPAAAALRAYLPPLNGLLGTPNVFADLEQQRARSNPRVVNSDAGTGGVTDFFGAPYSKVKNWGVQNTTVLDLGAFSIKNIAAYRKLDYENNADLDGSGVGLINAVTNMDNKFFSEEFQLYGKALDSKLEWITGLYYLKERGDDVAPNMQFLQLALANGAPATRGETSGKAENTSAAIYSGVTYHLDDQWSLSGGLRYTEDKREVVATSRTLVLAANSYLCDFMIGGARLPIGDCAVEADEKFDAFTYDATLQFKPTSDVMTYLSYRRGFRSGGFSGRARRLEELQPYDPEKVNEFELGAKTDLSVGEMPLRLNVALYHQDYRDIQKQISMTIPPAPGGTPAIATVIQNAAEGTIYGGELEVSLSPTPNFNLSASYSYIHGSYDKYEVPDANGVLIDRSNEWLVLAPKHSGSLSASYTQPLGDAGDLAFIVNWFVQSKSHLDDLDADGDQAGYGLLNLRLGWNRIFGSGFDIALWGRNVTDKEYAVGSLSIQDTAAGITTKIWGEPRTYGADLIYRFGAR